MSMTNYPTNTHFIDNKYSRWYFQIIENAKSQNRTKLKRDDSNFVYYEAHHILPECIYPEYKSFTNFPWNKVLLTAREHFICHSLLPKFTLGMNKGRMLNAILHMKISSKNQKRYTSKVYSITKQIAKEKNSILLKDKMKGDKNPMFGMFAEKHPRFGLSHTEHTRQLISKANKGKLTGDRNPSKREDVKKKISLKKKGMKLLNSTGKLHHKYNHHITDDDRKFLLDLWNIVKEFETLYSFTKRYSLIYNCTKSGIQSVVYKKS